MSPCITGREAERPAPMMSAPRSKAVKRPSERASTESGARPVPSNKVPLSAIAFTQGASVPSARFRVRQYVEKLRAKGIHLTECPAHFDSYPPASLSRRLCWLPITIMERSFAALRSRNADVVVFQREMISTLYSAERFCRSPSILDVDDAIWLNQRWKGIDRLAKQCQKILCGNSYIADYFSQFGPTELLPTAVDTERWSPGPPSEQPVLVWSGTSAGLPYLLAIEAALDRVLEAVPNGVLRIVCDRRPMFERLSPDRVDYVSWSEQCEVEAIRSASVGLMPMPDTPWSRGKCSFKLLTYLACGVPAVASPYGMNKDVIAGGGAFGAESISDWTDLVLMLLRDLSGARTLGRIGRQSVEASFSTVQMAPRFAAAIRDAAT